VAKPVRYPSGISAWPPRGVLSTMPSMPSNFQVLVTNDFVPYRAGDFTGTSTNGTAAAQIWNGGAVQLSTAGSTAGDKQMLALPSQSFMCVPGNQLWFDIRLALRATSTDANVYAGLVDNVDPSAASNGIYFLKPSTGTNVNFVIKKAGTTTTFQNIGDLAKPSGIYGDANSVAGTLAGTISGNAITAVSVATPGSGYQVAPFIVNTTAAGSNGTVFCQLGSTAYGASSFAQASLQSTQIPYGSLVAPYITNPGSGYTNGAASFEVDALIDLQFYFDAKGRLLVGVNGRQVMAIGGSAVETGVTGVTPGNTYNLATSGVGPSFNVLGTQLTTSQAPFQPALGSFYNMSPQLPLELAFGIANTTANPRAIFVEEYNVATEYN
jgi:hypothetical protein